MTARKAFTGLKAMDRRPAPDFDAIQKGAEDLLEADTDAGVLSMADAPKSRQPSKRSSRKGAEPAQYHAATREGMKRLLIPIEPKQHALLKALASLRGMSLEALARSAIETVIKESKIEEVQKNVK